VNVKYDIMKHISLVRDFLDGCQNILMRRGQKHDRSKFGQLEIEIYEIYVPKLASTEYGSFEYHQHLAEMGKALKNHYEQNPHHPEHFENGIYDMTLFDLLEMLCDWMAAAQRSQRPIDMDALCQRFDIDQRTRAILEKTVERIYESDV